MWRRLVSTFFGCSLILLGAEATLRACPICFQNEDAAIAGGVTAAVGVLGGITSIVLIAVGMFALRIARHEAGRGQR